MARRRIRVDEEEDHHQEPTERWMASYMDMVTVLMCMFIVLFAMSTIDQNKFDKLRNSLATGFGVTNIGKLDVAQGTIVPPSAADNKSQSFANGQAAIKEVQNLKALQESISAALAVHGLSGTVQFQLDERGLTIRLVDSQTFFTPNSTALVGIAPSVLDTIAPILASAPYNISVEGHADLRQPQSPFPTNWELSSGRAVQVLRRMVESGGVSPEKIGAVGYGSSRPLAAGTAPEALARNRRVDIVVLSNAPEAVRALIPDVLKGVAPGASTAPDKIAPFLLPASATGR
jgi:chemotaxis protein MotB